MTSTINEEGFFEYVFNMLSTSSEGTWYVFGVKLLECVTDMNKKRDLIIRINVIRRDEGWSLLND